MFQIDWLVRRSVQYRRTLCLSLGLVLGCAAALLADEPNRPFVSAPEVRATTTECDRLWQEARQLAAKKLWAAAVQHGEAALALKRKQAGSALESCDMLDALSYWNTRQRNYPAALEASREATVQRTLIFGQDHWQTVDSRENTALIERLSRLTDGDWQQFLRADQLHLESIEHQQTGETAAALEKATQALTTYTTLLGRQRAVTLTCLARVTQCQLQLGQYHCAQPNIRELIEAQPQLKGVLHPDSILAIRLLGRFNEAIGDLANAEAAFRKVLEIRTAMAGPQNPETIIASVELAKILSDRRKFAEAEPILQSALKLQLQRQGEARPDTAQTMKVLGNMYCDQGKFAEAEPLLVKSVASFRKSAGDKQPTTASAMYALGKCYLRTGRFQQANDNLMASFAICQEALGDKHPSTARLMDTVADLYETGANPGMARQLRLQCLKIAEDSFGEMSPLAADALVNLARTYIVLSDFALAEPYLLRAREIRRKLLGETHPKTAQVVGHLAYVYLGSGDSARAEPLFQQALGVLEKDSDADPTEAPRLRKKLALLYQSQGQLKQAAENYQLARKSLERMAGPESLAVAEVKVGLAQTVLSQGDCREACRLMDEALPVYERSLHGTHPSWLDALGVAATARLAADDTTEAERLLARALSISQSCRERAGAYQSERQRLAQMMVLRHMLDLYLSLPITLRTQGSVLYPYILAWKGATAARQWHDRQCASADTAPLDVELQQLRRRLASLTLHAPEPAERREWMGRIFKLTMRKEALEQQRAVYSAELQNAEPKVRTAEVQKSLPPGTALIDFLQYTHSSFEKVKSPNRSGVVEMKRTQRYLAFIVRRDRSTTRIDLGEVGPIEAAITKWRKTRGFRPDPGKTDWAANTGQLLWPHLRPFVDDCDTLLISPDGVLSQLAWNVLPGCATNRYLIEDFAIAMVPTPQLLPAILQSAEPTANPKALPSLLIVGNIDYNAPPAPLAGTPAPASTAPLPHRAAAPHFTPLKGTAAEVRAIEAHFRRQSPTGRVTMLMQDTATEESFWREAPRHRWLHVATHGFFAPPTIQAALATQNQMNPDAARRDGVSLFHVDYLNGLALAGANVGPSGDGDDGILTAAELAAMDLRNVDTVVLSGCETGLGELHGGEGAFGMQRALQIAGVRTTVGSLWTVSDEKTNLLMQRFYSNLWDKKLPRLQALREAQLWMLNSASDGRQRLSPHYWAAFTLSGDWR